MFWISVSGTTWIFTWKDRCIDLPWFTSPWCPISMVLNFTTGVWMDQNIKFASVLSGPVWSLFDELLWNKEGILSSKEWTCWFPIDPKRANFLLFWCWISCGNGTIVFANQVKLLHESSLEFHSFINLNTISFPNNNMNVEWNYWCIGTIIVTFN